jgi:K+-sensing histidine kinase KdpD
MVPAMAMLSIDVSAVEQILFNLVDNACKYAGPDATEKRLHVDDRVSDEDLRFPTISWDHGEWLQLLTAI